jgi:hypothetical protein
MKKPTVYLQSATQEEVFDVREPDPPDGTFTVFVPDIWDREACSLLLGLISGEAWIRVVWEKTRRTSR